MTITSQQQLEDAVQYFGVLPFFRNNIKGFSIEEMTPPGLLFGGNEFDGCWEWKGPVVRNRTSAYGKFFRRKAGFISLELFPYFLKLRRDTSEIKPGTIDEMIYEIICINDKMTSTDLRESLLGKPRKRTAFDLPDISADPYVESNLESLRHSGKRPSRHTLEAPLQRLQMGGRICISDFRYKQTKKGEKYGWGVAEYSTPEMLFPDIRESGLPVGECLDYIISFVTKRVKNAGRSQLEKLLKI